MSQEMQSSTKLCVACCEKIHGNARKCPHCQQLQTRFANFQNTNLAQGLLVLLAVGMIVYFGYIVYGSSQKASALPNLGVGTGSVRVGTPRGNPRVSCFATITNQDSVPWGGFSLQAEFFDAKGNRIDVHHYETRVTVHPSFSIEGIVSGEPNAEASEYATCVMKVTNAR